MPSVWMSLAQLLSCAWRAWLARPQAGLLAWPPHVVVRWQRRRVAGPHQAWTRTPQPAWPARGRATQHATHCPLQLGNTPVRGIHLGTGRHAEALAHLFHFLLQGRAQPHVRVGKAAVDLAELIRQRHVRIRFFGCFDPQIEQGACAGQLAATGFVFAQLAFEARKRLVDRCLELLGIGLRLRLVILLRAGQGLPA